MSDPVEIIVKINKFLKPFSDLIIFLFTTKNGLILLVTAFVLFFFIKFYNSLLQRRLLYSAAKQTKLPFPDFITVFVEEISSLAAKIVANITTLAIIIFVMLAIVTISSTVTSVDTFFKNEQKIKQLTQVLKNLDKSYNVAKVEIVNCNTKFDSTTIRIKFYDYANNALVPKDQTITVPGKDIYFLNYVMNFQYSQIENGKSINIAIPYAIFTDEMKQENAIKLNFADSTGIPFIFHRDSTDVYGMNYKDYNEQLQEIVRYMNDPEYARQAGVRSQYNAAPHFVRALIKGQTFFITVEQTGGLVLKPDL